jgi:hypothetical protein
VVVLPLDKAALPEKADEINAKLAAVRLPGADAPTVATISMETAQMQAECAEPTETCYLKIARLVDADRMLWAEVEKAKPKAAAKKKGGKPGIRIQVVLFDRDKLAVAGKADETFPGAVSDDELDKLITTATGVAPAAAAATTPPPAPVQPAPAPVPYAPQPAARPAAAPAAAPRQAQPAAQPAPQPAPTYYRQPAATPAAAPAAYPPSTAPAATAYPPAAAPSPAAYPPASAPPAAAPAPSAPAPARWQ